MKINLESNASKNLNNKNISDFVKQRKYANDNYDCRKEISLWRAVILQVLVDLKNQSRKKMAKVNRVKAVLWLNLQNKDFQIACSYANLDPFYVWEKSQIIKKNNPLI